MRASGTRNAQFEQKRRRLIASLQDHLVAHGSAGLSMRDLAKAAGVQVNTLQHYFGSRDDLIAEVFAAMPETGQVYRAQALEKAQHGSAEQVLTGFLMGIVGGWRPGALATLHSAGIVEGLTTPSLGPAYVNGLLEPTLQTGEALLALLIARQELSPTPHVREAALLLMSPVILALLHQQGLGGAQCRPLDLKAFIPLHVQKFLRAW